MKSTDAQTYVEVKCCCPYCDKSLDIFDKGRTREVMGSDLRAEKCELEITCPDCNNVFVVNRIYY